MCFHLTLLGVQCWLMTGRSAQHAKVLCCWKTGPTSQRTLISLKLLIVDSWVTMYFLIFLFPSIYNICCCLVAKACLTLCSLMDCSLPGSSVHGISQARILEWVAFSFTMESSRSRDWTGISCTAGRIFTLSHQGSLLKNMHSLIFFTV